jgi:hypothetical protein
MGVFRIVLFDDEHSKYTGRVQLTTHSGFGQCPSNDERRWEQSENLLHIIRMLEGIGMDA